MFQNGTTDLKLKARGRAISRAVDAAQIITNRFVPDAKVAGIKIGTEMVASEGSSGTSSVSSIEIHLLRQEGGT